MNRGLFGAQINLTFDILNHLNLVEGRVWNPQYPAGIAATLRGLTYRQAWEYCYQHQQYDLLLADYSLVQFRPGEDFPHSLSYSYLDCPLDAMTFADYCLSEFQDETPSEDYREFYEHYLTTCSVRESVTPLRFDYAPTAYREGCHPAAHIHIGHRNQIRICTQKILRPVSFVLFVIRQHYPACWERLRLHPGSSHWCSNVRKDLPDVPDQFFSEWDSHEMMLL